LDSIISDFELIIKPLNEKCDLSFFSCTDIDLNDFLKNDALDDQKYMISKTNLCFWKNKLVGFVALATDTIGTKEVVTDGNEHNKYSKYPGVKIARLAVDSMFERKGIGTHLLFAAIGKAQSISDSVGCRYILVDSKNESIGFYEKYDFKVAVKNKKKDFTPMYFDLQPVLMSIESQAVEKTDSAANIQLEEVDEEVKI
jgi:ribosomal protein S18 acetylase RimI-like enzyme